MAFCIPLLLGVWNLNTYRMGKLEKKQEKITAEAVYELLEQFIANHFCHLREKVDRIYVWIIGMFIALILDLLGLILLLITRK